MYLHTFVGFFITNNYQLPQFNLLFEYISIALSLHNILATMVTPCSVNEKDNFWVPPQLDITDCDIKLSNSLFVS